MNAVSIVVPYRSDNGLARDAAWRYVRRWWSEIHPDWQVVTGNAPPGPWVKALAVANALREATGDILIIADADVITDGAEYAVSAVAAGAAWCVPHTRVQRLSKAGTTDVLAGRPLPAPADRTQHRPTDRLRGPIAESYTGVIGGGMVVLRRTVYDRVPLDPRFEGFGQEDSSWGWALTIAAGPPPRRGPAPLWHLWHPPAPRMTRSIGSEASIALYRRYKACRHPAAVEALIAEAACVASDVTSSRT